MLCGTQKVERGNSTHPSFADFGHHWDRYLFRLNFSFVGITLRGGNCLFENIFFILYKILIFLLVYITHFKAIATYGVPESAFKSQIAVALKMASSFEYI